MWPVSWASPRGKLQTALRPSACFSPALTYRISYLILATHHPPGDHACPLSTVVSCPCWMYFQAAVPKRDGWASPTLPNLGLKRQSMHPISHASFKLCTTWSLQRNIACVSCIVFRALALLDGFLVPNRVEFMFTS
ncbi:hypothetical protein BO78DRAFT_224025 [Aspergillus sclerotiicarbonarius CBS 121057]|uniref:Uncharacterized protein n=1 Tax=Aspergillus sclerotiicarbonarius (strain CBS 121057 / IBT 28362) TaxID=1448318 RepID=A0A319F9B9_ASPSB|nr:hypothetical protein BO78DRAFT_224025 [Aspergillus sclerotiicarbonarius CBS 121057]